MDTQTSTSYIGLIISLAFFTVLLLLFILSVIKQMGYRIQTYKDRLHNEIEWIDKQRERLSADLHDEVGSSLATISVLLRQADFNNFSDIRQQAIHLLDLQRHKLKEIVYDWAPPILHSNGLGYAFIDLLEDLKTIWKISIQYDIDLKGKNLNASKSVHLFRIVKEILTNILKHAKADRIYFKAFYAKKSLIISIENNGDKFTWSAQQNKAGSTGLQNIKTRAGLLLAKIDTRSSVKGNTVWEIRIPVKQILTHDS